ncbi:hypothetical protein KA517_03825, partial [Candidatus Gracilibacteria bacterium]|nr:hypothetical protein [Candidatus Gracilibacteria bacterium]
MSINFRPKVLSAGRKVIFLDTNIISEINKVKLGHSQDPRYIEIHDVLVEKLAAGKICLVDAMQADELAVDTRYDHVALFKSWGKGVVVMQVNILEQLHILAAMRSYLLGENDVLLPFVTKDIDFIFDRLYSNSVRDNSPKNRGDLRDRLLQLRDRKTMLQGQWRLEILSVPNLILPRLESLLSRDGMNTVAAGVLMKRLGYP